MEHYTNKLIFFLDTNHTYNYIMHIPIKTKIKKIKFVSRYVLLVDYYGHIDNMNSSYNELGGTDVLFHKLN